MNLNRLMVPSVTSRKVLDPILGINSAELGSDELISLRPTVLEYASQHMVARKRLFLKTHDAYIPISQDMPLPLSANSIDRVVYLVRDPRDIAPSFARHMGTSIDDAIAAMADTSFRLSSYPWRPGNQVTHLLSSWGEHVKSWCHRVDGPPTCVIRFEDLVTDSLASFSRIVSFIDLRLSASSISLAVEATKLSVLQCKEQRDGFSEKPPGSHRFFHEGRPESWRAALTHAQVLTIEANHAEVMERFGYKTTSI